MGNNRTAARTPVEVRLPDFAPTYKLVSKAKMLRRKITPSWFHCLNRVDCLANLAQKPKHNPAWTDRVLMWHSDAWKVNVKEYSRRPVDPNFGSDHSPVVAQLE